MSAPINSTAEKIPSRVFSHHSHQQTLRFENRAAEKLPADIETGYQTIVSNPKYKHFTNIPERIIRCLDYFGISGDRESIRVRLQSYYLFIGVVDEAIDAGGIGIGAEVLDYLDGRAPYSEMIIRRSSVGLVTTILKRHLRDCYSLTAGKFRSLYQEVLSEREATSIDCYMDRRIVVGSLTAELSYLLILPLLQGDGEALLSLMKEVGAVGCLVDSLIDLSSDYRLGLLGFKTGLSSYLKLISRTMRQGVRIALKHPGLCLLFLEAIFDNVCDRISSNRSCFEAGLVSERKDQAASVA